MFGSSCCLLGEKEWSQDNPGGYQWVCKPRFSKGGNKHRKALCLNVSKRGEYTEEIGMGPVGWKMDSANFRGVHRAILEKGVPIRWPPDENGEKFVARKSFTPGRHLDGGKRREKGNDLWKYDNKTYDRGD